MAEESPAMEVDPAKAAPGPSTSAAAGTSESGSVVVASSATVGSVTVSLHPLVIMNISEHWTR